MSTNCIRMFPSKIRKRTNIHNITCIYNRLECNLKKKPFSFEQHLKMACLLFWREATSKILDSRLRAIWRGLADTNITSHFTDTCSSDSQRYLNAVRESRMHVDSTVKFAIFTQKTDCGERSFTSSSTFLCRNICKVRRQEADCWLFCAIIWIIPICHPTLAPWGNWLKKMFDLSPISNEGTIWTLFGPICPPFSEHYSDLSPYVVTLGKK